MYNKILLLSGIGWSSKLIANYLVSKGYEVTVIKEEKIPIRLLLKNRILRIGFFKVIDQVLFQVIIVSLLKVFSRHRINQIMKRFPVTNICFDQSIKIFNVQSINHPKVSELLKRLDYNLIVVNGTRIISPEIIKSTDKKIINTHCGITPEFRGSHGAYWAMHCGKSELAGVTIHIVEEGIDTGKILWQSQIDPQKGDCFLTYGYLQYLSALKGFDFVIGDLMDCREISPSLVTNESFSRLWSTPGITDYIRGIVRKVY